MCITWCHQRQILYWNHDDCHPLDCPMVNAKHGRCEDCCHRRDETCGLTNTLLPEADGCCHWNVEPAQGPQIIHREMLTSLGMGMTDTEEFILLSLDALYDRDATGRLTVDPDELGLPFTYGLGTEHRPVEEIDWSGWFGQWCEEYQG